MFGVFNMKVKFWSLDDLVTEKKDIHVVSISSDFQNF